MYGLSRLFITILLSVVIGLFIGFSITIPTDYYTAIAHCSEQYDKEQVKSLKKNVRLGIISNCPASDPK